METPKFIHEAPRHLRRGLAYAGVIAVSAGVVAPKSVEAHESLHAEPAIAETAPGTLPTLAEMGPLHFKFKAGTARHENGKHNAVTAPKRVDELLQLVDGAENGPIPDNVRSLMRTETAYMDGLGCSGRLIRNKRGGVIGAVTAEHCSLTSDKLIRYPGNDGNQYVIQPQRVKARTGGAFGALKPQATFDRFIVPSAANENNQDVAIAVREGHNPQDVLKTYRSTALTEREIGQLRFGEKVYMSSWPTYQPRNKSGVMERQSFTLKAIGTEKITSMDGKNLKVLWAAASPTEDGAVCSFGASGSEGFIMVDGKPKSVGVLSVFRDLTRSIPGIINADPAKAERLAKKPSHSVRAICGFAYETETPREHTLLKSVASENEIPGFVNPEQVLNKARAAFTDASQPQEFIDGVIALYPAKGGKDTKPYLVNDPRIYHDGKGGNVIGFASSADPDKLALQYYTDSSISGLSIYARDASQAEVGLKAAAKFPEYQPGSTDLESGYFSDGVQHIGEFLPESSQPDFSRTYSLFVKDGHLVVSQSMGLG